MKRTFAIAVATALAATLGFSGDAFARKTCADGSYPPCNTEGEIAPNNLSLPLSVTPAMTGELNITCPAELLAPTGDPISGYPIDPLAFYYVQGIHVWHAPCAVTPGPVSATAAWGDNLAGDAKLKVGSPIRVEIVLTENVAAAQDGYTVVKLDPAALDRESSYGTLAPENTTTFAPLVWDSQADLLITGEEFERSESPASAEVNATGKVVYGYNLRVPATGDYTITYTFPNVDVTGIDDGECVPLDTGGTACSLVITVGTGGGGGGGKKGGR